MVVVARKSVTSAGKTATRSYRSISARHSWGECDCIQIAAAGCAVTFIFVLNLSRPLHLFPVGLCRRVGVDQFVLAGLFLRSLKMNTAKSLIYLAFRTSSFWTAACASCGNLVYHLPARIWVGDIIELSSGLPECFNADARKIGREILPESTTVLYTLSDIVNTEYGIVPNTTDHHRLIWRI